MNISSLLSFGLLALATPAPALGQDSFTVVPNEVIETIGDLLPESSNAGASYLSEVYSPNLIIDQPATIQLVFLHEGAGYRNSLGYFTYRERVDGTIEVLSAALVIADASFPGVGTLQVGDTFQLKGEDGLIRTFLAGEKVGFFLVADGYNREPELRDGSLDGLLLPFEDPALNGAYGRGLYTTLDRLNPEIQSTQPEKARHLAMIWMPGVSGFLSGDSYLACGFEDLSRTGNSDEDFNDLVFVVDANPLEAIDETPAFTFLEGDPDGDGVSGVLDHYPNDPLRARVQRTPASGQLVVGFEDQYPGLGDADYNDVVLAYHAEIVSSSSGAITDLLLTYHLVARGAGYDHSVFLRLAELAPTRTGQVTVERFQSDEELTYEAPTSQSLTSLLGESAGIIEVFESTRDSLPPLGGATFTNTQSGVVDRFAASSRLRISFDVPVPAQEVGLAPYDLHIGVKRGDEIWDVHFPGRSGVPNRPGHLPVEEGPDSFLDELGRPWLLEVPREWRFPLEHERLWDAYPRFSAWAASGGAEDQDWYDHPHEAAHLGPLLVEVIPSRSWEVKLPASNQP